MSLQLTQTTIQKTIALTGKGLHSGRIVKLEILPAPANSGIVFQRTDNPDAEPVLAIADKITSTTLSTNIGLGPSSVSTIEHLMAAFSGLGITNALVKLDSPEVPILDGSSMTFVRELLNAGQLDLGKAQKYWRIKESFEIRNGDQFIRIDPADSFSVKCSIDFPHKSIGFQSIEYKGSAENFISICRSRTFCNMKDVNAMREQGLALGGSLDNAIVVRGRNCQRRWAPQSRRVRTA